MKQWITLAAATALLLSCTKENLQEENFQQQKQVEVQGAAMRQAQEGAYVSGWEEYDLWSKADQGNTSRFVVVRKTPEINSSVINGGLVLSYSKFENSEPAYAPFNNPKMMPFYFLPEAERPNPYHYYFNDASASSSVTVSYQSPYTKQDIPLMGGGATLQRMKFQYVVLTKEFLDAHNLNVETVRNYYSYQQVMNLVNP